MAFKKTFILSDESVNSYGFRIITAGIDLSQAKKNLPAFYNHKTWEIPLGHWENLRANEKGQLLGDLIIEGENEDEKEYIRKIQNGDIKGASGGFDPLVWNEDPTQLVQGQTRPTLDKSVIFEGSITPLPGNQNALALKTAEGLVSLSDGNSASIIPQLKTEQDMKRIALSLGLHENATEDEIIAAITLKKAAGDNAEAMRLHIEAQAKEDLETTEHQELFTSLSKANITHALSFLKLNKKIVATSIVSGKEGEVKKDVKLSAIIADAIKNNHGGAGAESEKDCFDYLQRHNRSELSRIHAEEPDRYTKLSKEYAAGKRYTGK